MNAKRKLSMITAIVVLCVTVLCAAVPMRAAEAYCTSVEAAAQIVREAMVNREVEVTITYPIERAHLNEDEIMSVIEAIYDEAIEHTGVGTEGDYLYFHENQFTYGFRCVDYGVGTSVDCILTFQFTYYTTAAQEVELTTKINTTVSQLNLSGKTDYEKVKAIYDYICANVTYDYTNLNNDAYTLKYSAYAALVNGTSVCQGYANLFYRLANAAGVDTRIVSGVSLGQNHAWNIVKLDGKYYNLDSTWDAGNQTYQYFLRGSANFNEHTPGGEQPGNYASYPISATDYDPKTAITPGEQPTEATTEATTEAPTEATTEAMTEALTEATTEVMMEALTEATTEVMTEAPTEATTEAMTEALTEATTEVMTEAPTETTTETTTEAVKPTQSTTESARPTQSTTEAEEPTDEPTEAESPTQSATEAEKITESTTEAAKPTQSATEAEESESSTEAEEVTENVNEDEPTETFGECGMPDPTTAPDGNMTDEQKDKPVDNTIYIVLGMAGVAIVGTAVGAGVVIGKKKRMND